MYPAKWNIIVTPTKSLSKGLYGFFDIKIDFWFLLPNEYLKTLSYYTCKEKRFVEFIYMISTSNTIVHLTHESKGSL